MKIAVAQIRPVAGEIETNISHHKKLIALAVEHGAGLLVFPELSITGYEPGMAEGRATTPDDDRFDDFQMITNGSRISMGIGVPVRGEDGIRIGLVIFQPNKPRQVYYKRYLHADETPYFVAGDEQVFLEESEEKIALAICYDVFVPEHASYVHEQGATVYLASVAKSAAGAARAIPVLSDLAGKYGMAVLMANCVGRCDDFDCGGRTVVIDKGGRVLAELNDTDEGILIFDTSTEHVQSFLSGGSDLSDRDRPHLSPGQKE